MAHFACDLNQEEAEKLYADYYRNQPFTIVSSSPVDLKQAVNTNKAVISLHADSKRSGCS